MSKPLLHFLAGAALLAAPLAVSPARAAPISATYAITASSFSDILFGTTPPADPFRLVLSISFDPAAGDQFDDGAGITLLSSTRPVGTPLVFDYDSANDILTVGGAGLSTAISAGTDDVLAELDGIKTGRPAFGGLEYTAAGTTGIYLSTTGDVSVPEPASMLVLFGGLLGLAAFRRRA